MGRGSKVALGCYRTERNNFKQFSLHDRLIILIRYLSGSQSNLNLFLGGWQWKGGREEVLRYNPDTDTWTEVGKMSSARHYHAIAAVSWGDYQEYCVTTESSQAEQLSLKVEDSLKPVVSQNISEIFF